MIVNEVSHMHCFPWCSSLFQCWLCWWITLCTTHKCGKLLLVLLLLLMVLFLNVKHVVSKTVASSKDWHPGHGKFNYRRQSITFDQSKAHKTPATTHFHWKHFDVDQIQRYNVIGQQRRQGNMQKKKLETYASDRISLWADGLSMRLKAFSATKINC